jgi:cytochrome P450
VAAANADWHADFDHHSEHYAQNLFAINAELRSRCPVAHSDAHGGFWVITRFDDVVRVATDDQTFASGYTVNGVCPLGVMIPPAPVPHIPIEMDPPDYHRYRKLLNPLFSPAMSRSWQPIIEQWANACLDQVIENGTMDLVGDLANPVPSLFTREFLGLPLADWRSYAAVMHEMVYTPPAEREAIVARYLELLGKVFALVAQRRAHPGHDVIRTLVIAQVDGNPIPDETVVSIVDLIMAGGFDTTTAITANALVYLADHPHDRRRLIEDRALIPRACEEFLRYFTPQQALARTVVKPVTIGTVGLQPGDRVLISWASANHDDTVFDHPDEVRLDRFPNRHTTFGMGIHRCLGSHIARAQLVAMVDTVLGRIPDYMVDSSSAKRYPSIGIVNGWVSVPATFTPGARIGNQDLP